MTRYKLLIEYDGTQFYGWQQQENLKTVQETILKAVEKFCGEKVAVEGAGRTDTGVHALGQVAHIDLSSYYEPYRVQDALNHFLRYSGTHILKVEVVDDHFHARFSAISRRYHYQIINRRCPLTLDAHRAWHVILPLDMEKMKQASEMLEGTHDFTSFRKKDCQAKSPIKTLDRFELSRNGDEITAVIESRSFLHNQVRIMMGTIGLIGLGHWTLQDLKNALDGKDRTKSGPTAPPHGLYLAHVGYKDS